MMKGKKKKLVVWLLALSMLMSSAPGLNVSATGPAVNVENGADGLGGSEPADTGQDDATVQDTGDASDAADTAAADEPEDADQQTGTDVAQDQDVAEDQDKAEEPDESEKSEETEEKEEEDEEAQESLINYLAVGQGEMQAPGEQYVIVSYGDGTEEIKSVKLVLTGEDGKQKEIPLTEKEEASYRFVKTFEENEAGTYHITRFAYTEDGHKKYIELEKTGISAEFAVLAGDAQSTSEECEEETGISVMALTSDDISDDMTSVIEETIQEAADEAVENVLEGAVELGSSSTEQSYSRSGVSAEATAAVDAAMSLGGYSTPRAYTGTASSIVVVLDPGHGGSDTGAIGYKDMQEKYVNLWIATYCKEELEQYNGITVYMTRTSDVDVSLEQRVAYARSKGATLFVSIHMNSDSTGKGKGAEVYYPNANYNAAVSMEGKNAAQNILNELVDLGLDDRGIKIRNSTDDTKYADGSTADYYSVIRNSKANGFPGIIVEHAFISNEEDAKHLCDAKGNPNRTFLKELGVADARGILKYCQNKTDYSPVYDFSYYVNRYSDVKSAYGNNPVGALQHFTQYGMAEGRQGSKEFSVTAYMERYPDLKSSFGTNYPSYYLHYINFGKKEGRVGTIDGSNTNTGTNASDNVPSNTAYNTIYDGTDYGDVYDYEYYITRYKDLAAIYSGNYAGALQHFVQNGMREGRQGRGTFDVFAYKKNYQDLYKAFGDDLKSYYIHYIERGKDEGRERTVFKEGEGGTDKDSDATTKYGLMDYSAVYNYDYYVTKYSDVRLSYGNDQEKVLQHFVRHGMDEGRSGNDEFNVLAYKAKYSDLRAAYGNDLKQYYLHYIRHGKEEGRRSDLAKVTTYQGEDYSDVYDFDYYVDRYSDIKAAFSNNPLGAIEHFITTGINEGRQAHPQFNIGAYKNNYVDLRNAFGDNTLSYVRHYIAIGKGENRNAASAAYHKISMVDDGTSNLYNSEKERRIKQMVTYFLANSKYPSYYATNTDVKDITAFCTLYYDESCHYGIKPEVAFCQAMKETKFLKFGGDVKQEQFNFAGLGATGGGVSGASFRSIQEGIRAQVQHLYAYVNTNCQTKQSLKDKYGYECVDPRFEYVKKGTALYVEWLGQKENPLGGGWATEQGYGTSIVNDYMNKLELY